MSSDLNPLDLPTDLPLLPDGWSWTALSRLVDPNRGICYGIVQPGKHHFDGIPMVNTGDVLDGRVNLEIGFRVEKKLHDQFRRSTLRGGELLVTLVGANFGRVAIAPPEFAGHNCSRAVGVVPLKGNTEFVMFALRSPVARHFFDTWANTTAQPTFNLKDLGKLPVPVPPVESAKQISNMLMALDDRITLLRETNATLEAIAQALFKSWFVDFDPVRAKAAGFEPQAMDAATAALFPDSFEESDLGLVPKGWRVGTLADLAHLNPESWTAKNRPESVAYIDLANAKDNVIAEITEYRFDDAPSRARRVLRDGDTIIGTVRPGNRSFAFIANADTNLTGSTGFAVLRPKNVESTEFVYLAATSDVNIEHLTHVADGGAYPAVRPEVVAGLCSVLPSSQALQAFHEVAKLIVERVADNHIQAQTLTQLRDTLLPRLISGQLRLPEAEMVVQSTLSEAS